MKRLILHIHDFLSRHRALAVVLLCVVVALSVLSLLRLDFQEDISAFLPQNEQSRRYSEVYDRLGAQDKMAVFFCGDDRDQIKEAMDCFEQLWAEADTTAMVPDLKAVSGENRMMEVFGFISSNWPYFLEDADYSRMEKTLSAPGYLSEKMASNREAMYSLASSLTSGYMRTDPYGLYTPVLERLRELNPSGGELLDDGYLFTPDGKAGVILFDSPFGSSESASNGRLVALLNKVKAATAAECPQVTVSSTGGPEVAVENASRIKKDSFLALALAAILIALVLWFSYKRFADVFWILVSILTGALFALGLIALFKSTVSIIVLGIGSMIIGIAVNYPLHYVDHLKYQPDKRKALADQVNPLLVGNITTVGAFLSLLLLKADALHDFGFIGAMMLVGTILFVLIFLPVFVPAAKAPRNTIRLDFDRHINLKPKTRRAVFAAFLVVTLVLWLLGRKVAFDGDMHNINYMTAEQSQGFDILSSFEGEAGMEKVYVVTEGTDADRALEASRAANFPWVSISDFIPSRAEQQRRLDAWNSFWESHVSLQDEMHKAAADAGFAPNAFQPFFDALQKEWQVQDVDYFEPLKSTIGQAMLLEGDGKVQVVDYIDVPAEDVAKLKEELRTKLPEDSFCFSAADVSGTLVKMLSDDFDAVGLICSLIVFFFLWLSFGSLELSIASFLPLAVGWIWILGTMRIFGLQFNIVNIILATFIFGQGDDYTVFITEGLMYEYATGKKILQSFKNAVVLSALIMFIGIGALIVARHPAMRSLAQVTIIGMFTVVVMAYYLPPLVFRFLTRRKNGELRSAPLTIGRILRTVYIFSLFLLAMLWLSLRTWFHFLGKTTEKKREQYHRMLQKTASLAIRMIPGCPFTMSNPTGEDFSRPAVYICNHQSHFDVLALLTLTPKLVFVTNDWVWHSPFYGYLIRKAECYPASDGVMADLDRLRDLVARGYSVAIFPEGTRSVDCSIQRLHRGAFKAAAELGVDVLPLYIHGFGYALPKKEFMLRKAGLYLEVGERIREIPEDLPAFTRQMRHHYQEVYSRIRREIETAEYMAPFVRYQYLYKGHDALSEIRKNLRPDLVAAVQANTQKEIVIENSGCGVLALLTALAHPDAKVTAYEADEEKYLTAVRCAAVPDNLEYIHGAK